MTSPWHKLHLDGPLLAGLLLLASVSLLVLYSAGGQDMQLLWRQLLRFGLAFGLMFALAQIPPHRYQQTAPLLFGAGLILLIAVLLFGDTAKGAQRWLQIGGLRFQPSELMKLAVPLMVAWYLGSRPLPPGLSRALVVLALVAVPTALIAKQPDMGTALLVAAAGMFVLLLSGLRWRVIGGAAVLTAAAAPLLWHIMHDYQRQRLLTFLDPEQDPLGTGYHIMQSTIAVGSGGIFGKGWLNGTQSYLDFIPERTTDFIFAVYGEEFGLIGAVLLFALFLFVIVRGLIIAYTAQNNFNRLVAGGLILSFFTYILINIGMVTGLLPVVGVPLPLISYGGTSLVTLMASFGILMSIHTHRIREHS
ncbi:MAG: rod shape-determining protein RodA [Gammaproteobacteria bacterium]|nr:rod shape-determining protein RodA [Gammaproteobacteria bacterium]